MSKLVALLNNNITIDSNANIIDYQYNQNANRLAIADSQGHIFIYRKMGQGYVKQTSFTADQGAIWSLAWGSQKFGLILAIGTYKKKVAIYQQRNNQWKEIAYHYQHQGSVNSVCWAPAEYGLKLFSAGSDGKVSIFELKDNTWNAYKFSAHQLQINSIDIEPLALNDLGKGIQDQYPKIVTASKDHTIKIWKHKNSDQQLQKNAHSLFKKQQYTILCDHNLHKQTIRSVKFRPRWCSKNDRQFQLISCSQNGIVRLLNYEENSFKEEFIILKLESPINRIAQSITGNLLMISSGQLNTEENYLYQIKEKQAKLLQKWDVL